MSFRIWKSEPEFDGAEREAEEELAADHQGGPT